MWPTATLEELAAPIDGSIAIGPFGSSMKADVYVDDGTPVIRGTNLDGSPGFSGDFVYVNDATVERLRRCIVEPGDLVFPHRGAIGSVGIATEASPGRWLLSTSMMKFRPDPERLDPLFGFYYFRSNHGQHEILKFASQVGTPGIGQPLTSLRSWQIPLPPINEQRRIASILGSLDDKIEHNRRTAQALERLARAIFKAWFVDFEPVKAKAEGATSFPSMPQDVFDAQPTTFVDTEIGPVPEGWVVRRLPEAFDINPKRILKKGDVVPYLGMSDMPTTGHAPESWTQREYGSGMRFINGDTLIARITPCLENGKTAYVDFLGDGQVAWGSTEYIVLRPKKPLPDLFAYCLARTREFREFAIQNMTGTSGRQRVSASAFDHYSIAVPSASSTRAFEASVRPMFEWIRSSMDESRKMGVMRDYLLPKLMSGEITVDESVETALEAA